VPTGSESARALAVRLRKLRQTSWPDIKITQAHLAEALGELKSASVPLISSWERASDPALPPTDRLSAYATFFSTRRSVEQQPFRVLADDELTEDELAGRDRLLAELLGLREAVLAAGSRSPRVLPGDSIVGRGPWHFPGDAPVVIVCAELPNKLRKDLPFAGEDDPDHIEISRLTDLDALFELHGHIRAVNPDLQVEYRGANNLRRDDSTAHLVLLGGVDWNNATRDVMRLTDVPVTQHSDDDDPNRGCFKVTGEGQEKSFVPRFEDRGDERILVEDVGHFFRAPNPLNLERTVTVCNGMYSRGVFGAVRALTDKKFRERNADYLAENFGGREAFSLLFRVPIFNNVVVTTPDWTAPGSVLHHWSEEPS
jgi:transcriptional regulator with XRE-family HTH domain